MRAREIPTTMPDLGRLTFLGRRALLRVLEHVIWGEKLSQDVCRRLADDTMDVRLRRHFETQAAEEEQHEAFFRNLFERFSGRSFIPSKGRISRSLHAFGDDLRQIAKNRRTTEALWGLGVGLEGLATVLFERSLGECVRHWPEGEACLRQIHREEARHVRTGRLLLDRFFAASSEIERRELKIRAKSWTVMIQRSFREIAWMVFPFPVPVRALQDSFEAFLSAVILEKGLASGDPCRTPVVGHKEPKNLEEAAPDTQCTEFTGTSDHRIRQKNRSGELQEPGAQIDIFHDAVFAEATHFKKQGSADEKGLVTIKKP